jgi:hypothetical protein
MPELPWERSNAPHVLRLVDFQTNSSDCLSLVKLLELYCAAYPDSSAETKEQYVTAVNLAEHWLGKPPTLADIFELERMESFVSWLVHTPWRGKPRSKRTVHGRRETILMLWDFAFRRGKWALPKPDKRDLALLEIDEEDPVAWSVAEMELILATARQTNTRKWWTADHWATMLDCYWRSAERVKAMTLCRLTDLSDDRLHIRAEYTKDGKAGMLRVGPALAYELRGLARPEASPLIWDFPGDLKTMRNRYKADILIPAGLPHDRKHLFHCIRRTSVTEVANLADEETAQRHARHTTLQMTRKYISKAKSRKKATSDLLPSLLGPRQKQMFADE